METIPLTFELVTDRLRLRAVTETDVELVWSATRHDGFNDGLTWDAPNHKSELVEYTQFTRDKWIEGISYEFVSELPGTGQTVGRTGIRQENSPFEWSIGFWVHPEYWGQGFAFEAGREIINFGFTKLNASKITTAHAIWNTRSKRVIEKLGFGFVGENPCGFVKNGNPVPEYEYEIRTTAH